jgi:DNA (cytosine-5)-methyltransferase 1
MAVELVLGGQLAWYAETDRHASTILAHHWPDIPNLGDIRAVDWTEVEPVDILTAGFPCQDYSE